MRIVPLWGGLFLLPLLTSTLFDDPYTQIKWFAVYGLAIFCPWTWLNSELIPWPRLPKWFWGVAVIASACFAAHLFQGGMVVTYATADRLAILILVFHFLIFFSSHPLSAVHQPVALASFAVSTYGLYQLFAREDFFSTFGNSNMCAEFLGFALITQVILFNRNRVLFIPQLISLAISGSYVVVLLSRSVFLALGGALLIAALKGGPRALIVAILIIAGAVGVAARTVYVSRQSKHFEWLGDTADIRRVLWSQSWDMFKHRPLGVGPGKFEFGYIPFALVRGDRIDESLVFRSPHNEYLRFLVEDGWVYFVCVALLISFIMISVYKRLPQGREKLLLISLTVFWLIQSVFQFPFENAFPSFLFALMLGYAASLIDTREIKSTVWHRKTFVMVSLAMVAVSGSIFWSKLVEREDPQTACARYAENWRACLDASYDDVDRGEIEAANQKVERILKQNPFHFPALQAAANLAFSAGDHAQGCTRLWQYDQIFRGQSSAHTQLRSLCFPSTQ